MVKDCAEDAEPPFEEKIAITLLFLGDLPNGFLQVSAPNETQVSRDELIAHQIARQQVQQQKMMQQSVYVTERLFVSVMEAKLNKNYGMVRMDPYCRVRINHNIYDTDIDTNGAKNPHWTKSISVPYSQQIKTVYLEVFDARALSSDSRIAWVDVTLPPTVKDGEPVDDWWPLSGKLGEEQEGTIHLMISKKKVQQQLDRPMLPPGGFPQPMVYATPQYYAPVAGAPGYYPPPTQQGAVAVQQGAPPQQPQADPVQPGPLFTDADVAQLKELFPAMEEDAIRTVLEASRGNKDAAINSLLAM